MKNFILSIFLSIFFVFNVFGMRSNEEYKTIDVDAQGLVALVNDIKASLNLGDLDFTYEIKSDLFNVYMGIIKAIVLDDLRPFEDLLIVSKNILFEDFVCQENEIMYKSIRDIFNIIFSDGGQLTQAFLNKEDLYFSKENKILLDRLKNSFSSPISADISKNIIFGAAHYLIKFLEKDLTINF
jgi:hypothetical protein